VIPDHQKVKKENLNAQNYPKLGREIREHFEEVIG
jgi:hypothetical protein